MIIDEISKHQDREPEKTAILFQGHINEPNIRQGAAEQEGSECFHVALQHVSAKRPTNQI